MLAGRLSLSVAPREMRADWIAFEEPKTLYSRLQIGHNSGRNVRGGVGVGDVFLGHCARPSEGND
jgi:hypothetical protein